MRLFDVGLYGNYVLINNVKLNTLLACSLGREEVRSSKT